MGLEWMVFLALGSSVTVRGTFAGGGGKSIHNQQTAWDAVGSINWATAYEAGFGSRDLNGIPAPARLNSPMRIQLKQINDGGPPDPYPNSKTALGFPEISLEDPVLDEIMTDIKEGIMYVLQTKNEYTFPLHGTGTTGMSAVLDNLIEPGDRVLVLSIGLWGDMMANMSERLGAEVSHHSRTPGTRYNLQEVKQALLIHRPNILAMVMGESDTGVRQPMEGIGDLAREEKLKNRQTTPRALQTDLLLQADMWNTTTDRVLAHTVSLPLLYSLREALATIAEEGVHNTFKRHESATRQLVRGLEAMGLEHYVSIAEDRMVGITTMLPPRGKDPHKIVDFMLKNSNISISTGFGPTEGKVLRIATFGTNANSQRVTNVLRALKRALSSPETDI